MRRSHESCIKRILIKLPLEQSFELTATLDLDQDTKKATIKIKDNVKWSDGEDVTADDVIFPYEIIGHKDYTGIRCLLF